MSKLPIKAAILALAVAVSASGVTFTAFAAQTNSAAAAKQLDAANKAVKAQKWDEAIAKLHEVGAIAAKTPYDTYVMNQLLSYSLMKQNKFGEALPALESNLNSGLASAAEMTQIKKQLLVIYFNQKNYVKAVELGQGLVAAGAGDDGTNNIIAQSYEKQGKLGEAVKIIRTRIDAAQAKGAKPAENDLLQILEYQRRLKDEKGESESFEKLVSYYPKGDYWANVMAPLTKSGGNDDVMSLAVFRLMRSTGTLKKPTDITEMAQLAKEQGSAGESLDLLQQAITGNVFTEARDKDRNVRLLEAIKKQVATEQAALAKADADSRAAPSGDADVAVARTYYGLGQYDKAVEAVKRGIAKGKLTTAPEEAQLLLGMSLLRQKKGPEAIAAFKAVKGDPRYVKLASLWAINAKAV